MPSNYDYYLLGCRDSGRVPGIMPISRWRFNIAYSKLARLFGFRSHDLAEDFPYINADGLLERRGWLKTLDELVSRGREIYRSILMGNDEPGTSGCGDREPIVPRTPVLSGTGARPLPREGAQNERSWWRT